ncbi:MAG: glycosyltransferase [Planctomycetaceae bacterium]|nr:glycosyltransferase [Planctomycetaceae bacterium]
MTKKISIILPVRNVEKKLVRLIGDCFEASTDTGLECEIVIINDHSTDATEDVANALALKYPQVQAISFWRQCGLQKSILNGIQYSTGNFLYIFYSLLHYSFPQISLFYNGMMFCDAILGRIVTKNDNYVEIAMFKKYLLNAIGEKISEPSKCIDFMQERSIRFLELRYEHEINSEQQPFHFSNPVRKKYSKTLSTV